MSAIAPAAEQVFRLAITPIRDVIVRDANGTGNGSWTMEGYAAVYDEETTLWDGNFWRLRERIARDAFTNVLARVAAGEELVHFNFGHEMNTSIAATDIVGVGRLELSEDFRGLRFWARVDPNDPDAQRLAVKLQRGVVRQASFAFQAKWSLVEVGELEDGREDELWEMTEVTHLYDVCACPQGAYPQTESHLRSLMAASAGRFGIASKGLPDRDQSSGRIVVAPVAAGDVASTRGRELQRLQAYASARVRTLKRKAR